MSILDKRFRERGSRGRRLLQAPRRWRRGVGSTASGQASKWLGRSGFIRCSVSTGDYIHHAVVYAR